MHSTVLLAALAAGLGVASAGATEPSAGGGNTPPASPPVTTISKAAPTDKPAAAATVTAPTPVAAPANPIANPAEPPPPGATVAGPASEPADAKPVADKPKGPPPPTLIVKVNLSSQRLEVIQGGSTIHTWPISSGRSGYETPRGTFRAQWAAKMWYSRKYDLAPMPHAVFINGGVAIHATSATGMLGRPASHGCIRLAPGNAATFYSLVHKHGLKQTQVQVFGSPPAARISEPRRRNVDEPRVRVASRPTTGSRPGSLQIGPGSPYYGQQSFEHNGIRYVRVR